MNQRETDLKTIAHELAVWETKIANLNSLNLNDANIIAEYTIAEILNMVFGYQLKINTNSHQAAIDLTDIQNKIAFQVTATKTTQKVKQTLERFIENGLDKSYDQLFILILGTKQQRYSGFGQLPFQFDPKHHILDFQDLLRQINLMPSARLRELAQMIGRENKLQAKPQISAATALKRSLTIKRKLEKELIKKDLRELYDVIGYEPHYKFIYGRLMIRSVEDRLYPELDPENQGWFRMELWDFYDHGLEFVGYGREIIYDKDLYWDILEADDPRKSNPNYQHKHFSAFLKIAFDDMVEYDPEPDRYHGYPSLFCHFSHDGEPFIGFTYGIMGSYKTKKITFKFEPNKRKKLP